MSDAQGKARVMALRSAFRAGWASDMLTAAEVEQRVRDFYPLPKVTRPRVVADHEGFRWRIVGNERQFYSDALDGWRAAHLNGWDATNERILLWADLLANPTEEVEEDA